MTHAESARFFSSMSSFCSGVKDIQPVFHLSTSAVELTAAGCATSFTAVDCDATAGVYAEAGGGKPVEVVDVARTACVEFWSPVGGRPVNGRHRPNPNGIFRLRHV
jgi:hypothetical protein